jgi:NAD(P)-dependent dehydrogenase (short-subunit alcohol dehydrogenase family)
MESIQKKFRLDGQTGILTGAAGLLGNVFSRMLLEAGAAPILVDVDGQRLQSLKASLDNEFGKNVAIVCGDICAQTTREEIEKMIVKSAGKLDFLINNAATKGGNVRDFFKDFSDYDWETWDAVMRGNVGGMFLLAQLAGKWMVKNPSGGRIVQVASIYGVVGPDQRIYEGSHFLGGAINTPAIYSASKSAVVGLTKYLATLWAKNNIRVNTLTPGGNQAGQNETFVKKYSEKCPMGRMANPSEMAGPMLFLLSEASSYVTGHNLVVDGGWTAW